MALHPKFQKGQVIRWGHAVGIIKYVHINAIKQSYYVVEWFNSDQYPDELWTTKPDSNWCDDKAILAEENYQILYGNL